MADNRTLEQRFGDADSAIDLLQTGWVPKRSDLESAPKLDEWYAVQIAGELALIGTVSGHPDIPDGRTITTSALLAFDMKGRWARTFSRFYALGPQLKIDPALDFADEAEQEGIKP
jgi:hypothetical protein